MNFRATKHFFLTILMALIILSCQQREWDNPFDPDCPKELFTPSNFQARQQGKVITLVWSQPNNTITGFKIERKVGDGVWQEVATPGKTSTKWNDDQISSDKLHEYRIYAVAGNNISNKVNSQIKPTLSSLLDIDGNIYNIVTIGTQVWMAENLKTTKFVNGDDIPYWTKTSSRGYCWYNDDSSKKNVFGAIYNFYSATDVRKICPPGWHIPTKSEWNVLVSFLGGESVAGGKLKVAGIDFWSSPNTGASNSSGFSAYPGGARDCGSNFVYLGTQGHWWSSDFATGGWVGGCVLYHNSNQIIFSNGFDCNASYVRCLKD